MKIKSLKARNFCSYSSLDLSLDGQDLIGIIGRYTDDSERSNGSRKSTLVELILYVLFGRCRMGKAVDSLIKVGETDVFGSVEFEMNNMSVLVDRSTKIKKSGKSASDMNVIINGDPKAEGVTKSEVLLAEILGTDYDVFTTMNFFVQENSDGFTSATAGERQAYVRKIDRNMRIFELARDKAAKALAFVNDEVSGKSAVYNELVRANEGIDVSGLNERQGMLELENEEHKKKLDELQTLKKQQEEFVIKAKHKQELALEIRELAKNIEFSRLEIETEFSNLVKYNKQVEEAKSFLGDIRDDIEDELGRAKARKAEVEQECHDAVTKEIQLSTAMEQYTSSMAPQIREKEAEIDEWRNTEVCRVCDSRISDLHRNKKIANIEADIVTIKAGMPDEQEIIRAKELAENLKADVEAITAECEKMTEVITQWNALLTTIEHGNEMAKSLMSKVEVMKKGLSDSEARVSELQAEHDSIEDVDISKLIDHDADINKVQTAIDNNTREIGAIDEQVSKHKENADKIYTMGEELREYAEDVEAYAFLVEAFGRNGIPNMLTEVVLSAIQEKANAILAEVAPEMSVEFVTQKETKKGSTAETLDIMIEYNGVVRPYETYSGGERTILNFAIRLAISQHMAGSMGKKIELVVLDEVFGALDSSNRAKVVSVLQTLRKSFKQIFVISHSEIKDCFPHLIEVERDRAGSSIRRY